MLRNSTLQKPKTLWVFSKTCINFILLELFVIFTIKNKLLLFKAELQRERKTEKKIFSRSSSVPPKPGVGNFIYISHHGGRSFQGVFSAAQQREGSAVEKVRAT